MRNVLIHAYLSAYKICNVYLILPLLFYRNDAVGDLPNAVVALKLQEEGEEEEKKKEEEEKEEEEEEEEIEKEEEEEEEEEDVDTDSGITIYFVCCRATDQQTCFSHKANCFKLH